MKALNEYRRLKKLARVMDGKLSQETISYFMELMDDQVMKDLKVSTADMKKMAKASSEKKLEILTPYFEKTIQDLIEGKINEKLLMAERIAHTIASQTKSKSGMLHLPYQAMLMLTQLNPSWCIRFQTGQSEFLYPTAKLKQVLSSMDQARIVWDARNNVMKVMLLDNNHRNIFHLYGQDQNAYSDKTIFNVQLESSSSGISLTEIIFKAAEAIFGV
jgi:hypothetical protein